MSLKPGCYLLTFKPDQDSNPGAVGIYAGTLRVTKENKSEENRTIRASGDLYHFKNITQLKRCEPRIAFEGDYIYLRTSTDATIPIFPFANYSHYLEVKVGPALGNPQGAVLEIQPHKFDSSVRKMAKGANFQLELAPDAKHAKRLTGRMVIGEETRGRFSLQWISANLRRASLRIICLQPGQEKSIKIPGHSLPRGEGVLGWKKLFGNVGWELEVLEHSFPVSKFIQAPAKVWSAFDLATVYEEIKDNFAGSDQGEDWAYNLLCVSGFENDRFLGIMFDSEATDLNQKPRESAAVAALQKLTVDAASSTSQDAFKGVLYYRTAVHEVGHMLNLTHTYEDKSLMNTTDFLLTPTHKKDMFDFKPTWSFHPEDQDWLQHAPDIAIRPGGISRSDVVSQSALIQNVNVVTLRNEASMTLTIKPVLETFPFGAPVRLDYALLNQGLKTFVPADISLPGGSIFGRVTGPDRKTRYFRSAFRCCDSVKPLGRLMELDQGETSEDSMTLLRGIDAALFPCPGVFRLELELRWDTDGQTRRVVGETSVTIEESDPNDPDQRRAAEIVLNGSAMMPVLVQGLGNDGGLDALGLALQSKTLAPHYRATALKCYQNETTRKMRLNPLLSKLLQLPEGSGKKNMKPKKNAKTIQLGSLDQFRFRDSFETVMTKREKKKLQPLLDKLGEWDKRGSVVQGPIRDRNSLSFPTAK